MTTPQTVQGKEPIIAIIDRDRRGTLQLEDSVTIKQGDTTSTVSVREFVSSDLYRYLGNPSSRLQLITQCSKRPFAVANSLTQYTHRINILNFLSNHISIDATVSIPEPAYGTSVNYLRTNYIPLWGAQHGTEPTIQALPRETDPSNTFGIGLRIMFRFDSPSRREDH